jgi:hypothetical protein
MSVRRAEVLPTGTQADIERREDLIRWWQEISRSGDAGATTWEVLDRLRDRVTECLYMCPPDLCLAESFTAQALFLIECGRLCD